MTNEELKQKCLEYDIKHGPYFEYSYSGMDLYYFIIDEPEVFTTELFNDWDKCLKNIKL